MQTLCVPEINESLFSEMPAQNALNSQLKKHKFNVKFNSLHKKINKQTDENHMEKTDAREGGLLLTVKGGTWPWGCVSSTGNHHSAHAQDQRFPLCLKCIFQHLSIVYFIFI